MGQSEQQKPKVDEHTFPQSEEESNGYRLQLSPLLSQGVVFAIIKTGLPISVNVVKIIPHEMLSSSSPR